MRNLNKQLGFSSPDALISFIRTDLNVNEPKELTNNPVRCWLFELGKKLHEQGDIEISWGEHYSVKAQEYLVQRHKDKTLRQQ